MYLRHLSIYRCQSPALSREDINHQIDNCSILGHSPGMGSLGRLGITPTSTEADVEDCVKNGSSSIESPIAEGADDALTSDQRRLATYNNIRRGVEGEGVKRRGVEGLSGTSGVRAGRGGDDGGVVGIIARGVVGEAGSTCSVFSSTTSGVVVAGRVGTEGPFEELGLEGRRRRPVFSLVLTA